MNFIVNIVILSDVPHSDITRIIVSPTLGMTELGIPAIQKITRAKTHGLLAKLPDQSAEFVGNIDLSHSEQIELYRSKWYSWITKKLYKVDLPEDFKKHFDAFIRSSQELCSGNFDCLALYLYLNGFYSWYQERRMSILREDFLHLPILRPIGTEPIGTGFLISELPEWWDLFCNNHFHVALSLGNGMYISKLFSEGHIAITTWKELRKLYPFNTVTLLYKKPNLNENI